MWQLLGVRLLLLFIQWWFIKPHIINQAPGCQDTADSSAFDSISANHSVQHKVTPWTVHRSVTDKPPSTPTLMCQISQEWTGTQMSSLGRNRSSGFTKWEPPGGAQKIGRTKKCIYFYLFVQNCTTLNCHNGWIFRYLIVTRMTPSLSGFVRHLLSSYSASKACV